MNEISNDEVVKFCQMKERQDKTQKASEKTKAKAAVLQQQLSVENQQQQQQQQSSTSAATATPLPSSLQIPSVAEIIQLFQQNPEMQLPSQRSASPFTIADLLGEDMNY